MCPATRQSALGRRWLRLWASRRLCSCWSLALAPRPLLLLPRRTSRSAFSNHASTWYLLNTCIVASMTAQSGVRSRESDGALSHAAAALAGLYHCLLGSGTHALCSWTLAFVINLCAPRLSLPRRRIKLLTRLATGDGASSSVRLASLSLPLHFTDLAPVCRPRRLHPRDPDPVGVSCR